MAQKVSDVVGFLDASLEVGAFRDYGPNGLQVEAGDTVHKVATGVSASMELFRLAAQRGVELLVVHHGLFWGSPTGLTGIQAQRIGFLFRHGISLAAYHLPLDKHGVLGNNVGLADAIGLGEPRSDFGNVRGHALGLAGCYEQPISRQGVIDRIAKGVGMNPRFVFPFGPEQVQKVGICTGAASDLLEDAARSGCDLFVTGELAERAGELARELGINLVAAGHYATEVFGVQRIGEHLRKQFSDLDVEYIEVSSPI